MGHTAEEKIKILYEDSLSDIRELTGRMELMTAAVVAAAQEVNNGKTILHKQNENFLMQQIAAVRAAADDLLGMQEAVQIAAVRHANTAITPLYEQVSKELGNTNKNHFKSLQFLGESRELLTKTSRLISLMAFAFFCGLAVAGVGGWFVGTNNAEKQIPLDLEWVRTEDGQAARKLAAGGDIRRLLNCSEPGWKIEKKDGKRWCAPLPSEKAGQQIFRGWALE